MSLILETQEKKEILILNNLQSKETDVLQK